MIYSVVYFEELSDIKENICTYDMGMIVSPILGEGVRMFVYDTNYVDWYQ